MRVENLIAVRLSHTNLPFLVAFKIVRQARKYSMSSIYETILKPMELWKVAILLNKLNKEND